MKRIALVFLGILTLVTTSLPAQAKLDKMVTYRESTVWRCAIRFLRVDQHYRILERDKESGYLLFEYDEEGRSYRGSMEIMPVVESNLQYVRVKIHVADQPSYIETLLFKKFTQKLRSEYGTAPAATPLPEPEAPDTGASKSKGESDKTLDKEAPEGEEDAEITEDDLNGSYEE